MLYSLRSSTLCILCTSRERLSEAWFSTVDYVVIYGVGGVTKSFTRIVYVIFCMKRAFMSRLFFRENYFVVVGFTSEQYNLLF